MSSPIQLLAPKSSLSGGAGGLLDRSESIRSRWAGREIPNRRARELRSECREFNGEAALPPHLEPNPIARTFSRPSMLMRSSAAVLSWTLLAGLFYGASQMARGAHRADKESIEPRTVTLVFNHVLEESLPSGLVKGSMDSGNSSEPARGAEASEDPEVPAFDPRNLAEMEAVDAFMPLEVEQNIETNLLPMRPVAVAGASASGRFGGVGREQGEGAGGRGQAGTAPLSGQDMFLSGTGKGMHVEVDTLDILNQEIPRYPEAARSKGIDGDVVVEIVIDEKGIPIETQLVRADDPLLVPAVTSVVPRWRFKPVLLDRKRVRANFRVCFRFILNGK